MTELSNLNNDLKRTEENARKASSSIELLRKELAELLSQYARGTAKGTGAGAGIPSIVQKLESGEQVAQRPRIGGGQYLSPAFRKDPRIQSLTQTLQNPLTSILAPMVDANAASIDAEVKKLSETAKTTTKKLEDAEKKLIEKEAARLRKIGEATLAAYERSINRSGAKQTTALEKEIAKARAIGEEEMLAYEQGKGMGKGIPRPIDVYSQDTAKKSLEESNAQLKQIEREATQKIKTSAKDLTKGFNQWAKERADYIDSIFAELEETAKADKYQQSLSRPATTTETQTLKERYPKAFELAESKGFTGSQQGFQVKAFEEASNGITRLKFAYRDLEGAVRTLDVTQNKFGQTLVDTQRRFRTLGDAIVRDTVEVFKWSIAVAVVYAPMQKLNELIKVAIQNQSELANIAVVLGQSQDKLNAIFEDAATVAAKTGESINGVLESYTLAYRATGRYVNENQRAAAASKLLSDSLILAKLSGMDHAAAIDTLVGALNQLNMPLTKGDELLNKWVAVTKVANVDLKTLAESFAITSASAESAGLSVDQLNGIIATLAEATTLSATEAGNAVRAIISGLSTDGARKELGKLGISVEDANGQLRNFMDVLTQIASLREAGVISQDEFKQLSAALGGQGARRGAQVEAVIVGLGKAQKFAEVSANATTEAYDALGIKIETVDTKITKLGNAFQVLAQSLGEKGGILDIFSQVLEIANSLVLAVSKITDSLGKVTPLLIGLGAVAGLTRGKKYPETQTPLVQGALKYDVIPWLAANSSLLTRGSMFGQVGGGVTQLEVTRQMQNALPTITAIFTKGIVPAMVVGSDILKKDIPGAGSALAGAAVGALLTAGNPVGIAIGTVAGQAFADSTFNRKVEFENFFASVIPGAGQPGAKPSKTEQEIITEDIFKAIGGGSLSRGKFQASSDAWFSNAVLGVSGFFGSTQGGTVTPETQAIANLQKLAEINDKRLTGVSKEEVQVLMDRLLKARMNEAPQGDVVKGITTPFSSEVAAMAEKNSKIISDLTKKYTDEQRDLLNKQQINNREFQSNIENAQSFGIRLTQVYAAMPPVFKSASEAYTFLMDTLGKASEGQNEYINQLVTRIADITNKIEDMRGKGIGGKEMADLVTEGLTTQRQLDQYITGVNKQQYLQTVKLPAIVSGEGLDKQESSLIEQLAKQKQSQYYNEIKAMFPKLTDQDIQDMIDTIEPWFLYLEDQYSKITGIDKQFWEEAKSTLEKAGTINTKSTPPGIQVYKDLTASQLNDALSQVPGLLAKIKAVIPDYQSEQTTFAAIVKDGITGPITTDLQLLSIILQEIADNTKKTVDGIYNLPANASFYVPFQGYAFGFQNKPTTPTTPGTSTTPPPTTPTTSTPGNVEPPLGTSPTTGRRYGGIGYFRGGGWGGYGDNSSKTPTATTSPTSQTSSLSRELATAIQNVNLSTKLTLNMTSTTQILVDGRLLASMIKQYLYEDLIRYEGTGGGGGGAGRVVAVV